MHIYYVYKRPTSEQKSTYAESEEMEKLFHVNKNERKAGIAIHVSNKIDLKTKVIWRDKERHYIMIKGTNQQGDITFVNIYESNIGAPKLLRNLEEHKGKYWQQ